MGLIQETLRPKAALLWGQWHVSLTSVQQDDAYSELLMDN